MARAAFSPTPEQRELVRTLSAVGTPQDNICLLVKDACGKPITGKTLRRHFRGELDEGAVQATAKVAGNLYRFATDPHGGLKAVTAAIFWMKTRGGWKETQAVELTGKDGAPVEHKQVPSDLGNLSDDELAQLETLAAKIGPAASTGGHTG